MKRHHFLCRTFCAARTNLRYALVLTLLSKQGSGRLTKIHGRQLLLVLIKSRDDAAIRGNPPEMSHN